MPRLLILCFFFAFIPLRATTLVQMSLDQMSQRSTVIVRGRVSTKGCELRTGTVYTRYTVQVTETWKGLAPASVSVLIPGGATEALAQSFAGAPVLAPNGEYVLFLWAGKSGMLQVIGLSQGVFTLQSSGSGTKAARSRSTETMLNASGGVVADSDISMPVEQLKTRVRLALAGLGAR